MINNKIRRAVSVALSAAVVGGNCAWAADGSDEDPLSEVVVTGSRLKQDPYTSSAPMEVLTAESATSRGVSSVAELLQSSTVAAGSPQITSASSTTFVQSGGIGASTLSLRGLGANRTLVLLNGRRAGPAGTRGEVSSFDLNVIPLSAVDRVEILKDGASSVYGSDAIAGVVNIITKKDDGGVVEGFVSRPTKEGGSESRLSASWGRKLDRGYFRVTADYHRENELAKGDRSWYRCNEAYIFDRNTGARRDVTDPRTGKPHCNDLLWGHVWLYDYASEFGNGATNIPNATALLAQYDYDGNLGQYIPGYAADPNPPYGLKTPPGWYPVNYDRASAAVANADHPFQDGASLVPKSEHITAFVEGDFEINDSLTAYGEVLLNRRRTHANSYRQFWGYLYNEDFDFVDVTPGAGNPLSAGWQGAQWLSPTAITDHADDDIEVRYHRFVGGLRGDLSPNWNWDVSYQYSRSDGYYTSDQIYNDAIRDQNFAIGSCVGTFTSVRGVPCQDIPWLDPQFLAGNISPDMQSYLFGRETGRTRYTQWTIEGFVAGELFDMPAGSVSVALGANYQYDKIIDKPGELTLSGNVWNATVAGITQGNDTSRAVFGEFKMPLLADLPAVKALTLNGSVRYTDVASYGDDTTYKTGINWEIVPGLRLRANRGTSFRSPTLFELYLADQTGSARQSAIDPCVRWQDALNNGDISQRVANNCAAAGLAPDYVGGSIDATVISGGGYGRLKAETSTSNTVGLVLQPRFADISLSVDYFDIEVKNEVSQLGAQQIVFGCYNSEFFPTDPLCSLFERTTINSFIDNVQDSYINIAQQRNRGWDVGATYRFRLGPGKATVDTRHTFQIEDRRALFAETSEDLNGEFGHPKWVGNFSLTYELGDWEFFWRVDAIGKVSNVESYGGDTANYFGERVRVVLDAPVTTYNSFSVKRKFDSVGLAATLGMANAFNQPPPQVTTLNLGELDFEGRSAFYTQYDPLGRRVFLNLKKTF